VGSLGLLKFLFIVAAVGVAIYFGVQFLQDEPNPGLDRLQPERVVIEQPNPLG
jgi:hypothetical protein